MPTPPTTNRHTSQSVRRANPRIDVLTPVLVDQHWELRGLASLSKADRSLLLKAVEATLMKKSLGGLARRKRVSPSDLEQRVRAAEKKLNLAVQKLRGEGLPSLAKESISPAAMSWTSQKNSRRLELIQKETYDQLSATECSELAGLQQEMFRAREQYAPIPLAAVQKFYEAHCSGTDPKGAAD